MQAFCAEIYLKLPRDLKNHTKWRYHDADGWMTQYYINSPQNLFIESMKSQQA